MASLPCLLPHNAKHATQIDSVVFAVFAPFGTDPVLSEYPDNKRKPIRRQTLVKYLLDVARQGVHVSALIDLIDDDTYLIEIPAGAPKQLAIHSAWKQRMSAPQALAGFLRRTHHRFPCSSIVLALEGHGAGFLPEIDASAGSPEDTSQGPSDRIEWRIRLDSTEPVDATNGNPVLAMIPSPELPVESPEARPLSLPLSTWALSQALRSAIGDGVPKPAVIHFNNCFNMAVEVLHTVAPYTSYATGYTNYNFFTAGETYPKVFKRLRQAGSTSAEQLAKWFATENGAMLGPQKNQPTIGATIALRKMNGLRNAIAEMSKELTAALKAPGGSGVRTKIKDAVAAAQQYDTGTGYQLEVPDQLTDLADFAFQLKSQFPSGTIHDRADDVMKAVGAVWQYGEFDRPYLDETKIWDFRNQRLGISIFFPDPLIQGQWDWRSPYYMKNNLEVDTLPRQPHVIDFLADGSGRSAWVKFLIEYHKVETNPPRMLLLRARPPVFPIFMRDYKPKYPHPTDDDPRGPGVPGQTPAPGDDPRRGGSDSRAS